MTTLLTSRNIPFQHSQALLRGWWMAAALLVLSATHSAAQTIPIVVYANPNPASKPCVAKYSARYTTIQDAVDAAPSGGTVVVCPGTYPEQVTIGTSLTLKGVAAGASGAAIIALPPGGLVQNAPGGSYPIAQVLVRAPNVTLDSLVVDAAGLPSPPAIGCALQSLSGINFNAGSSGTVNRVALRNHALALNQSPQYFCGSAEIEVTSTTAGPVTIQNSSFRAFGGWGIWAMGSVVVHNNVLDSGLGATPLANNGTGAFAGAGMFLGAASTVASNTIANVNSGIACFSCTAGSTISANHISADDFGINMYFTSSGVALLNNVINAGVQNPSNSTLRAGIVLAGQGNTVKGNKITGMPTGILELGAPTPTVPETIQNNSITDADIGIVGVAGNLVSGNTYLNVITLTTPTQ
jgi:hypothetical protein